MSELNDIMQQLSKIGARLESFANTEKNFNNIFSASLEKIGNEIEGMSTKIEVLKDFFVQ